MMAAFALNLAATCIYAVFSAARKSASDSDAHHTLVVVSALEVILNLATTMKPDIKILSFEGTHLAERLSLLTLIILGEGQSTIRAQHSKKKKKKIINIHIK